MSSYQKVGIEGQWILGIGLENKGSPIDSDSLGRLQVSDLHEFLIIEETGNMLPTYRIMFTSNSNWKQYWNESSKLSFTLSTSINSENIVDTKCLILSKKAQDIGNGLYVYTASGTYDAPAFTQTPHVRTLGPSSGTETIKAIVKPHFKSVEVTASSTEGMAWYQMNTTDKKFCDLLISHSYIPNSFPSAGITMNGTYLLKDTVETCKGSPIYTIGTDIMPIQTPKLVSRSGFMNHTGVYGLDIPIVSGEYGVRTTHRVSIKLGLGQSSPPSTGEVDRKTLPPIYFNSCNVDENYIKAKANYNIGQALTSMELMEVVTLDFSKKLQVLDVVKVLDILTNSNSNLNQDTSGKYLVNKVARGIKNNRAILKLQLGRDAHN